MPTRSEYVPAAIFLEHGGVTIYHVYKDNDVENGARQYWYSLDEDSDDNADDDRNFNVETLFMGMAKEDRPARSPAQLNGSLPNDTEWIKAVLRLAIDRGMIGDKEDADNG